MSDPSIQLHYATHRPTLSRRLSRRWRLLTLLSLITAAAIAFGPKAWKKGEILLLQSKATRYLAPNDYLVQSRVETTGHGTVRLPPDGRSFSISNSTPSPWSDFVSAAGIERGAIIYFGLRRSPSGHERIVHAYIGGSYTRSGPGGARSNEIDFVVTAQAIVAASVTDDLAIVGPRSPQESFILPGKGPLNIFAATPHATDPSAFTFRVDNEQTSELIDGFLRDDDTIEFVPRNPAVAGGTVQPF